ncbi:AAA family ATPase [Thiofilum flexile]|uniref:AAA family ATPase n=1 Tax=Thiofilum flexile TaxID=125627 RepID=UPI00037807D8|nr:AAA family ATPase [Thiofilum flexile]
MKLKTLQLKNFRRFADLSIDFDSQLTVIVARNGQGKTTLLDAATIALGTFVGAFDLGKANHIERSDARHVSTMERSANEQQYPVKIEASFLQPELYILRQLMGPKNKTTIKDASALTDYGKRLQASMREFSDEVLPVVAYYGTGRLWKAHKNMNRKAVLSESRSMGYEDCLSSASNFVQVQQWMAKATLNLWQQETTPGYEKSTLPAQVKNIQATVDNLLADEGWSNFHYSSQHEELAMQHPDHGILPVGLLSDGVRAMISLAADLAWRCTKLNPQLGHKASIDSPGIVMIDEVDMHLHPVWQQKVIASLQNAFPNIQFIVTTHSPQVLSTVPARCIRILGNETVRTPELQTQGLPSADILANIQTVDPVPDIEQAHWLSKYKALIQQYQHESEQGLELRQKLDAHFGKEHPAMLECERLIRLMAMKKKLPTKRAG